MAISAAGARPACPGDRTDAAEKGAPARALSAAGRPTEALREFQRYRKELAETTGMEPGPEGSLAKLNGSLLSRLCNRANTEIVGAHGMLIGEAGPQGGMVNEVLVSTPAMSIAGGTDEIQHNIIAKMVLGL